MMAKVWRPCLNMRPENGLVAVELVLNRATSERRAYRERTQPATGDATARNASSRR